jgi:hypothetical protein
MARTSAVIGQACCFFSLTSFTALIRSLSFQEQPLSVSVFVLFLISLLFGVAASLFGLLRLYGFWTAQLLWSRFLARLPFSRRRAVLSSPTAPIGGDFQFLFQLASGWKRSALVFRNLMVIMLIFYITQGIS